MRTKEEVKEYIALKGFTHDAAIKIAGFLIGAGIKKENEYFRFTKGWGTFKEFYDWYTFDETNKNNKDNSNSNWLDFFFRSFR